MEDLKLFESEYRFMDLVWKTEPVKSMELAKLALETLEWKKSTCYTVLKRLEQRGFVKNENAVVTACVGREQVQRYESEALIQKNFGGSFPAFLNAFLKDRKLTREEAGELHRLIEEAIPEEAPDAQSLQQGASGPKSAEGPGK